MTLNINFSSPLHIVLSKSKKTKENIRAIFTWQVGDFIFKGENVSNTMQSGTYATLSVQWSDKSGNPAKVDGPTNWVSSDPTIADVTVATGNPLIANVHSLGPIGPVQVQATADADLGEGVRSITATCDISVIAGEAFAGEITFTQSPAQGG